jgi:hypothetical protein
MTANPHPIDLPALLESHLQRAEPDLLRSMLTMFVQALMGADADAACGAEFGSRSPDPPRFVSGRLATSLLAPPQVEGRADENRPVAILSDRVPNLGPHADDPNEPRFPCASSCPLIVPLTAPYESANNPACATLDPGSNTPASRSAGHTRP